jgi:hypothetical protein
VSVRRRDGSGPTLVFKPDRAYLDHITTEPADQMEPLSRACVEMAESELFVVERIEAPMP